MAFENCITEINGGYQVNFAGTPSTIYSTQEAAKSRLDKLIQEAYKKNIKSAENGGFTVKYGNNPTTMFSTREQAISYLNNQIATGGTKAAANPLLSGIVPLQEGGYEVKLKGQPTTRFTNQADAVKYYNNLVNNTFKKSIVPNPDGGFDVKPANGPTRRFSTQAQAEAFLKQELGIKEMPAAPAEVPPNGGEKGKNSGKVKQSKNVFKRFGEWVSKTWKSGAKGKAGLILGAAALVGGLVAGAIALFGGKDKKAEEVKPEETNQVTTVPEEEAAVSTVPTAPTEPAVPVEPETPKNIPVIVGNNETIETIARKYGVSVDDIKKLNADKIKHYHNSMDANDTSLYDGFEVGTQIVLPTTARVKAGGTTAADAKKAYEDAVIKQWDDFAPERLKEIASPEFQQEHKLVTVG